jgi:hypothetical protein
MRIKQIILLTFALCATLSAVAQRRSVDRELPDSVLRQIEQRRSNRGLVERNNVFVPKGQWIFGGTASYSVHHNNDYKALIIEDIQSKGYTFKASPLVAYAITDNMALGLRFNYGRTFMRLDNASLSLGEGESATNLSTNFYYGLKHTYSLGAIWRQYIPLGRNKRFAIFNEVQLAMGGAQSKYAQDSPVNGTYSKSFEAGLSVSPGIIAFASNTMAIEVSVGVMGIQLNSTKQLHNQVEEGRTTTSFMNFSINLLSIGLGVSFYL